MIETVETQRVELSTADGPMQAFVAQRPAQPVAAPGIIVFQEAFGVNAHIRNMTERFAKLGFVAIAPELFHRTGDGIELPYGDMAGVKPHREKITTDGIAADSRAAFAWLAEHADPHRVAAIGFCMGGMAAYVANATLALSGAISFYGVGPLELAGQQHSPLLMFWGGRDQHITTVDTRAVADSLTAAGRVHEQVTFSHAGHGFMCDQRPAYDPPAAAQAWALVQAFLRAYGFMA
jgi:carboxymethylenebutenolidase